MKNKKASFDIDSHLKEITELAKNAPEPEQLLAELECGNYSSLDPDFLKTHTSTARNKSKKKYKNEPEANI